MRQIGLVSRRSVGPWVRLGIATVFTAIVLVPVGVVFLLAFHPATSGTSAVAGWTVSTFRDLFSNSNVPHALMLSFIVSSVATIVAVSVSVMAGYVVSRRKTRAISGYALSLFVIQCLPSITVIIPLFVLFAKLHLVNDLGVVIVYVGGSIAVATWMMAAYFNSIPVTLEESAWVDGCSRFGGFVRVVLPCARPALLSAAVFCFLQAWNDFLVADVFLQSPNVQTMPVAIESFFTQYTSDWGAIMAASVLMISPPLIVFFIIGRRFSLGGIAGAVTG